MNKERRSDLTKIVDGDKKGSIGLDQIKDFLEDFRGQLEDLQNCEQEAFDNMPESLQNGEKGEKSQAAIDALEQAVSDVEEAVTSLDSAMTNINTAQE